MAQHHGTCARAANRPRALTAYRPCVWCKGVPLAPYHNAAYYQGLSDRTDPAVHNFERDLMFLLHDVARLIRVDADKRARAHGMTRAQWGILIWLERQPGISQKELSELLEVEPITVARLIDRLEARGMVERRPDPRDRRIWRLHLQPAALPVLCDIGRHRAEITHMVTAGLDNDTIDTLTGTLLRMKTVLIQEAHAARRAGDPADSHAHREPGHREAGHREPGHREAAHREAAHREAAATELA